MAKNELLLELHKVLYKMEKHCNDFMKKSRKGDNLNCSDCEFYINNYDLNNNSCLYKDIKNFRVSDTVDIMVKALDMKISKERKVKYPYIYKHFKGGFYVTIGISKPVAYFELNKSLFEVDSYYLVAENGFNAVHTETNDIVIIYKDSDGNFYHQKEIDCEELVIYKSLYSGTGAFARPIDIFLSKVDKEKYLNTAQEYRFEEFE
ncbi:DUF1653 domain-containing protein [Clostridioides sp. GD02377]|uniref:DUF1653 domain-containing protein n=1 Tax=unclassified Clostridioides TaxID=2635829 RepID=UPI0038B1E9D0